MKEIVAADIPQIKNLLQDVLQVSEYTQLERMGGLTNHTYRVTLENGQIYVVRLPGEGTEELINRNDEKVSTQLACKLGIDAELLHFGKSGEKVTCYIDGAHTLSVASFQNIDNLRKSAEVLRALHTSGADTKVSFDVFQMASDYEKIIRDNSVALFDGYEEVKAQIMQIRAVSATDEIASVPCHNDPLCENWVLDQNGKLYLIDWEYAGMNDGMWDLADVSIEASFTPEQDHAFLQFYFGREATQEETLRFHANKLYLDFLWSLWGKREYRLTESPWKSTDRKDMHGLDRIWMHFSGKSPLCKILKERICYGRSPRTNQAGLAG